MFKNEVVKKEDDDALSTLILKGDISKLTDAQKVDYYRAICNRLGVDPMTKPFDYLVLQGKQTLYLNKGGAEQLSKIHGVSLSITDSKKLDDIYVVTARAEQAGPRDNGLGVISTLTTRHNESTGAVSIKGLYGDALCNAMMKAETKAKRRATIGLLGLAMLDETEVETIPNATKLEYTDVETGEVAEAPKSTIGDSTHGGHITSLDTTTDPDWNELITIGKQYRWPAGYINQWISDQKKSGETLENIYARGMAKFSQVNNKLVVQNP